MKRSGLRSPVKDAAVVIGPLSAAMRSRIARALGASVAPVPGAKDAFVIESAPGEPRELFRKINDLVGSKALVAPVLADQDGKRLFPTGELQVRFHDVPSDDAIAAFVKRHSLGQAKRNKWAPKQVAFALRRDDRRFLPEITERIGADRTVDKAWPDVRARYRRFRP